MRLSKSLYIRGLQCTKSLWLKKYNSKVLSKPDESTQSVFKTGDKVGALACQLFPNGKKIPFEGNTFEDKIELTKKWIDEGVENIYEATFEYNEVLVMVDILHINPDGSVEIYEVKSSTWGPKKTKKDLKTYIDDASIQFYVLSGLGLEIKKCSITLLNNQYVFKGTLDVNKLFTSIDVLSEVEELQEDIPTRLKLFSTVLSDEKNEYKKDIGAQCKKPYLCDAYDYCWKTQQNIPEYSVFNIFNMGEKPISLYKEGIVEIKDIPDESITTDNQRLAVDAWLDKAKFVDIESIKNFVNAMKYPICHLDFETYTDAIPSFNNQRPYQQICFQYSLHVEQKDGSITHKKFLGKEGTDPREEFIKHMINDTKGSSTILVYNESFEKTRIKELADDFPQYSNELLNINENILDLGVPFKEKWYYDYRLQGKWSIKLVMPLLAPHMADAYKKLPLVQNGGDAMNIFPKLIGMDDNIRAEYKEALLKYCELDTLSMVEILKKLKNIVIEGKVQ